MSGNDIPMTTELCGCGSDVKMLGWRVCYTCAEARIVDPDMWEELDPEPDKLPGDDGISEAQMRAFVRGDMAHVHDVLWGEG